MERVMTPLQKKRASFQPPLPKILKDLKKFTFEGKGDSSALGDVKAIASHFPHTFGNPILYPALKKDSAAKPLKVGVVLSGGQASGGHNVITGLFDALKNFHAESQLLGFLGGPLGIIEGRLKSCPKT